MKKSARPQQRAGAEELTGRQAILRAATRMFLKRGYRGTSMELVAQEAGFGRQTVYNQFESKKALFDATVTLLWAKLPVATIVEEEGQPPEQVLLDVGNAIAEHWASDEAVAFARMIIAESIHFPDLADSFFTAGRDPARSAVSRYLSALGNTAGWDVPDPDLAAAQFVGLLNEPLLWTRVIRGGKAPAKERRRIMVAEAVRTFACRYRVASKTRRH